MATKLTLKLNKNVIEEAKAYAFSQKRSLSSLIEAYLSSLITKKAITEKDDIKISPYVNSLKTGVKIPDDYDYKKDYSDFLSEKYK